MNIYVIIAAVLFVVLMVAFGRNPIEEAHEAKLKKSGDPLVNAIEEYNAKPHMHSGPFAVSSPPSGGQGFPVNGAPRSAPGYMNDGQQPNAMQNNNGQNQGYYPPLAGAPNSPQR